MTANLCLADDYSDKNFNAAYTCCKSDNILLNQIIHFEKIDKKLVEITSEVLKADKEKPTALAAQHETLVFGSLALFLFIIAILQKIKGTELSLFTFGSKNQNLRKPNFLNVQNEFQNLLMPSISSVVIICGSIFAIMCFFSLLASFVSIQLIDYDRSVFVTIQAGTIAILFPLVILILDSNEDANSLVVSKREVLLRHALAFPIGLILLLSSLYFIINGSSLMGTLMTVVSVFLAFIVLYRLLEITFSFEVSKREEERLLQLKVQNVVADDLAERVAYKNTENTFKDLTLPIKFEQHIRVLLEDHDNIELIKIDAINDGSVAEVSTDLMLKAAAIFNDFIKQLVNKEPNDKKDQYYGISLSAYPGKLINSREGKELATLILPTDSNSKMVVSTLEKLIRKAIKISSHSINRGVALDVLMSKLGQSGRLAVRDDNQELMESVKETFELVYENISGLLIKFSRDIKDIEDPRTSRTFGKTSNPHESLVNLLAQLQREAIGKKGLDKQVLRTALYLPHSLAYDALANDDVKSFYALTAIAYQQLNYSVFFKSDSDVRETVISWLSGILKYRLIPSRRNKKEYTFNVEDLMQSIVAKLQYAGKSGIDANDIESVKKAIEAIDEITESFRYEYYEHTIETLKWQLDQPDVPQASKAKIAADLKFQTERIKLKKKLTMWTYLSSIALANYALQNIEGANEVTKASSETSNEVLKLCLSRIPQSLKSIIDIALYFEEENVEDGWGWSQWETHPLKQVYSPHTSNYVKRIFALLFYRSATSIDLKLKPSSYNLDSDRLLPFRTDEYGLRKLIASAPATVEFKTLGIEALSKEQIDKLFKLFDEFVAESKLQKSLALTSKPLSGKMVAEFRKRVSDKVKSTAFFRNKCDLKFVETKSDMQMVIHQYTDRSFFVEDSPYLGTNIADDLGESFAHGEDQRTFNKVLSLIPAGQKLGVVEEAIEKVLEAGVSIHDVYVIISHKTHYNYFESVVNNFTPAFRIRGRELPDGVVGIITFNGVEVPVVEIRIDSSELRQGAFVTVLNNILLEIKNDLNAVDREVGVVVEVKDPIIDEELRKITLERIKDELKGIDPSLWNQLVGKQVTFNIHEIILMSLKEPKKIFEVVFGDKENIDAVSKVEKAADGLKEKNNGTSE